MAHSKKVIEVLVPFHASTYDFLQKYSGEVEGFKADHHIFFNNGWLNDDIEMGRNIAKGLLDPVFDTAIGVMTNQAEKNPDLVQVLKRLIAFNEKRAVTVRKCLQPIGQFNTLIHNDCRTNNFLFR